MQRSPSGKKTGSLEDFGEVFLPQEAQEPILAREVRTSLMEWLTEYWAREDLEAVGLKPRQRALFSGVPGVGKTTMAHHLAARIGLPMVSIRPDRVLASYLNASANALGYLFDLATEGEPFVLFFDEFDSLAQKRMRGGQNPVAETDHNSMVNVLLQRLDDYKGFIIASTNEAQQIDEAVWRRFEVHIEIKLPGQAERERIIDRYLSPFELAGEPLARLAEAMDTATPALIRQFCEAVKRNIVVGPKAEWNMAKEAVVDRIVNSVRPHQDLGLPRLWSQGPRDIAIRWMPWPLPLKAAPAPKGKAA